ncbi:MAG: hypothetical protein GC181_10180 [Bacteroidetes bacterium]|nr:hypothetical protein [Bacteroidota bacterium]
MAKNPNVSLQETANFYAAKTGIEIPQTILDFYADGVNQDAEDGFIQAFKVEYENAKQGYLPEMSILISESFASEILKLYFAVPEKERIETTLAHIKNHPFNEMGNKFYSKNNQLYHSHNNQLVDEDNDVFLLDEIFYAVKDYDVKENQFNFSLVQKAYENCGCDDQNIKVILLLWAHCGGEGGLIVKGKNTGYETGYAYLDDVKILYQNKVFRYPGFLKEEFEKPMINPY